MIKIVHSIEFSNGMPYPTSYEIINEANAAMLWQTFSDELRVKLQRA